MDRTNPRNNKIEIERTKDILSILPKGKKILDVGALDGYFSILFTSLFDSVTALDLKKPDINHKKVSCVKGDISSLEFLDGSFDVVFCAEVLEHIPKHLLQKACSELTRVASEYVFIGVPYKQDNRIGRTTCYSCGQTNPPCGHINAFNEQFLFELFKGMTVIKKTFVGSHHNKRTNFLSVFLLDLAGNPSETYSQKECCIYCGNKLLNPPPRNILQRIFTRVAFYIDFFQNIFVKHEPIWMHVLFKKTRFF